MLREGRSTSTAGCSPSTLARTWAVSHWKAEHADYPRVAVRPVARGVSATTTAKAYRLLRAVLMTAVEEDKILPRNPCRIRGAGSEQAPERLVLTVAQVFELVELVG